MNRQKALMKKYLSRPENRYCADCKRPSPTWASLNLGVFVCIKCSGCHREIGVHITKIKSVELDLWPSKALTDFAKINNEIANAYWEYDLKNYDYQRIRDNEIRLIEFIRDKYEFRRWAKPRVPDPMSLVIQGRDLIKEFMNNGEAVKMYEKSEEPELEKRSQHFGRQKNEKKGKSFGIVDKVESNNTNNNNNANNNMNNDNQMNNNNMNNKKPEKGFGFIKRKQNKNDNNNAENNSNVNSNNNNIDLLGFGNEQNDNNANNINQSNSNTSNNFPIDIFSIGIEQPINTNNQNINLNNNINNNINNNNSNNINSNQNNIQNDIFSNSIPQNIDNTSNGNKAKSGFSFIKKKNINQNNQMNSNNTFNNNNPSQNSNNTNDINDIFNQNSNPIKNTNTNNNTISENNNNSNINQNTNNNNTNNSNNNTNNDIMNIFENDQLVDLFNIETPTSDAVLNLSKNLLNVYSEKEEDKNIQNNSMPNNMNPNSSNYNVLNMNYPNININNYYPNTQLNKNKGGMMNNNYGMNPMMGYNYPPQPNYNNFGFWYGYGMNNNMGGQYMGMNMNNGPINPGFNYQAEFYKKEKDIEKDEPKPIILNNNSFELNLRKNKEKDDPFKNLVNFK